MTPSVSVQMVRASAPSSDAKMAAEWSEPLRPSVVGTPLGVTAMKPVATITSASSWSARHSAAIFASLLGAEALTIWTDTDGVMSADPRYVPDAQRLDSLSYEEAMELAYFGAGVIHPRTLAPAVEHEIPITIRNTFAPDRPGTRIHLDGDGASVVKGFSTIDDVALQVEEGHEIGRAHV